MCDSIGWNHDRALVLLSMIFAQALRVCREGIPVSTFPDHAPVSSLLNSSNLRRASLQPSFAISGVRLSDIEQRAPIRSSRARNRSSAPLLYCDRRTFKGPTALML
jgi:hypothetical protein